MNKSDLFLELARPDADGFSRWVSVNEFTGRFSELAFGNGASWARKESSLAKKYIVEFDKSVSAGNSIDRVRLKGYNDNPIGNQHIRSDIRTIIKSKTCIILGTSHPEVDHKNGWKNDQAVRDINSQTLNDFQPLSKAANDAKRQFCKECRISHKRYDAKLLGYPISFYKGTEEHDGSETGCIGCFWYDPIEFRKNL